MHVVLDVAADRAGGGIEGGRRRQLIRATGKNSEGQQSSGKYLIHVLVSRTSGVEEVEVERRRCIPLVAFPLGVGRSFWCCVSIRRFVGCDGKQ